MSAIEERIRKLLALADSPNENEAAAAAEKAQALMLRYGIEMATVAASGGERLAVDEHVVDGKVDPWRRMLAAAVARSAGGRDRVGPGWLRPRPGQDLLLRSRRARSAGSSSCTATWRRSWS